MQQTRTFAAKSLIRSEFQYFATQQKSKKISTILKLLSFL